MTVRRHQHRLERDAVSLADGSLPASRQARVERAIADSPPLRASVAVQRRALRAIRESGMEDAPAALRARLELARDPRPRWWASRPLASLAATAALATAALSLLLLAGGGASSAPTVAAVATLGWRAPTVALRASAASPGVSAAGIAFPDWSPQFGLRAVGIRRDRLDGRLATTVFYGQERQRIAYTIVSGAPLPAGAIAHGSMWGTARLETMSAGGRVVVSWLQSGHSCVLSATTTPASTLSRLAASENQPSVYG